jgi:hypothetical protein
MYRDLRRNNSADDEQVVRLVQLTSSAFDHVDPWSLHTRHATPNLAYA